MESRESEQVEARLSIVRDGLGGSTKFFKRPPKNVGGRNFGDELEIISASYRSMLMDKKLGPGDLEELEGITKYLHDAESIFETLEGPKKTDGLDQKDYFGILEEKQRGIFRIILLNLVKEYNAATPENKFDLELDSESTASGSDVLKQIGRFISHIKKELVSAGFDKSQIDIAENLMNDPATSHGVYIQDRESGPFQRYYSDKPQARLIEVIPVWLRKQTSWK